MTNNKRALITTPIILAPILFGLAVYHQLPSTLTTHWNVASQPDGYMPKPLLVFGLPVLMALLQLFLLWVTARSKDSAPRLNRIVMWLLPVITVVAYVTTIQMNLGATLDIRRIVALLVAVIFLIVGNYLPTVVPDQAKPTAVRFNRRAGYLFVIGGLGLLISLLFGSWVTVTVIGLVILGLILLMFIR